MRWGWWVRIWALGGLVVGCLAVPSEARAQNRGGADELRVILSPGLLMAGGAEMDSGLGGVVHLAVERARHRVLLRVTAIVDVSGFPDGSGDGHVTEFGVLYGRRGGGRGPGWSLSAGLAAVHFQHCPAESTDSFYDSGCSTVGVPLVAEAGVGTPVVGIALQLFGNLNAEAPFAGVGLSVPLGWMP